MRNFIYFFIFVALGLFFQSAPLASVLIDRLESAVNNEQILHSDVEYFRKTLLLRSQLDPMFANTPLANKEIVKDDDILQFLIDEKIITQAFPIKDAEVEQQISSIESTNRISRRELKDTLSDQGFSFNDYFELIRINLSKRNLIDREIRVKINITEDDVKNYFFNKHLKSSSLPVSYHIKIISVSPSNYKTAQAAKAVTLQAKNSIDAGEPFEAVAKRVSDDNSATTGGDLGKLEEDKLSPLFKNTINKMKIGEVSDVVGSAETNFYILKLTDISSTDPEKFKSTKDEIRNFLYSQEYQNQITLWLERQRQNAYIHKAPDANTPKRQKREKEAKKNGKP